jgi:biotin carboxylase
MFFEGKAFFFGTTRAAYHENSNSFFYHAFPSPFPQTMQEKLESTLRRLIFALGINNSFFNVELRADEKNQTFKIIEVSSRIAFQFAKTIEAVTGFDPLYLLCDVAVGKKNRPWRQYQQALQLLLQLRAPPFRRCQST